MKLTGEMKTGLLKNSNDNSQIHCYVFPQPHLQSELIMKYISTDNFPSGTKSLNHECLISKSSAFSLLHLNSSCVSCLTGGE